MVFNLKVVPETVTLFVEANINIMKRTQWLSMAAMAAGFLTGLAPVSSWAQRDTGISARAALDFLSRQYGADKVEWVVEMRGSDGVPTPEEWEVFVYDPDTRFLTREYWVGDGEATNEGPADDYFPDRSTFGYIRVTDLKLDSAAAFTIAEGEARKARMGFDRLNYTLRCREFSREPVWTLELVDSAGALVGKVYISGSTGEVLRTVWIQRPGRGRTEGASVVMDSAAPRGGGEDLSQARPEAAKGNGLRQFTPETPPGPPLPLTEPDPSPTTVGPKKAGTSGVNSETDTRIPPPPGTKGEPDTRIPPPPIPPAP